MHRVFVYGTLKRGFRNHQFLEDALFVGEAYTLAAYGMLDGPFPVLRDAGSDLRRVSGELFEVDDETLAKLDDLEGVADGMYERIETEIALEAGSSVEQVSVFIYIGRADYWDKKGRAPYRGLDKHGHLNWTPPNKRPK